MLECAHKYKYLLAENKLNCQWIDDENTHSLNTGSCEVEFYREPICKSFRSFRQHAKRLRMSNATCVQINFEVCDIWRFIGQWRSLFVFSVHQKCGHLLIHTVFIFTIFQMNWWQESILYCFSSVPYTIIPKLAERELFIQAIQMTRFYNENGKIINFDDCLSWLVQHSPFERNKKYKKTSSEHHGTSKYGFSYFLGSGINSWAGERMKSVSRKLSHR